jgi:hypothetical protein
MLRQQKTVVGVIGGHNANTTEAALLSAEYSGRILAQRGITIACGGEDGIMEAVCKGAKSVGGTTIGILKGKNKRDANAFVDYAIPTSLDLAFMNVLIWFSDGILGFDGRYGTLSEIGLALDIGRPCVLVGKHVLLDSTTIDTNLFKHFPSADLPTVDLAVQALVEMINRERS